MERQPSQEQAAASMTEINAKMGEAFESALQSEAERQVASYVDAVGAGTEAVHPLSVKVGNVRDAAINSDPAHAYIEEADQEIAKINARFQNPLLTSDERKALKAELKDAKQIRKWSAREHQANIDDFRTLLHEAAYEQTQDRLGNEDYWKIPGREERLIGSAGNTPSPANQSHRAVPSEAKEAVNDADKQATRERVLKNLEESKEARKASNYSEEISDEEVRFPKKPRTVSFEDSEEGQELERTFSDGSENQAADLRSAEPAALDEAEMNRIAAEQVAALRELVDAVNDSRKGLRSLSAYDLAGLRERAERTAWNRGLAEGLNDETLDGIISYIKKTAAEAFPTDDVLSEGGEHKLQVEIQSRMRNLDNLLYCLGGDLTQDEVDRLKEEDNIIWGKASRAGLSTENLKIIDQFLESRLGNLSATLSGGASRLLEGERLGIKPFDADLFDFFEANFGEVVWRLAHSLSPEEARKEALRIGGSLINSAIRSGALPEDIDRLDAKLGTIMDLELGHTIPSPEPIDTGDLDGLRWLDLSDDIMPLQARVTFGIKELREAVDKLAIRSKSKQEITDEEITELLARSGTLRQFINDNLTRSEKRDMIIDLDKAMIKAKYIDDARKSNTATMGDKDADKSKKKGPRFSRRSGREKVEKKEPRAKAPKSPEDKAHMEAVRKRAGRLAKLGGFLFFAGIASEEALRRGIPTNIHDGYESFLRSVQSLADSINL